MRERVIEARGLTRRFGDFTAVDSLDLDVDKGTIYGFLGPNGSGKTTTVRMLIGLLTPSAGRVNVLGRSLPGDAEPLKREIGYMTQKFYLYEDLSVRENLQFFGAVYGLGGRELRRRIDDLIGRYGLRDLAAHRPDAMSGGQRQRLALAAATIHAPKLLFLDEPTSAVDPESRREFWEQLFDLVEDGASILVSTHYMDEAERCHRLAILSAGRKCADGSPRELMKSIGVAVLEIETDDPRMVRRRLEGLPEVLSAAQLGVRLRVLVMDRIDDPVEWFLEKRLGVARDHVRLVRPNLEDVFVTRTLGTT